MKKISTIVIIFFILISFSILVEATTPDGSVVNAYGNETKLNYEVENKKREKATKEALSTLLEKYKDADVPEEERILEYRWNGYGVRRIEDETTEFKCTINFSVTPYSEENTNWDESRQMCFAEFDRLDGELVLNNISLEPDKYEEFMKAFEEYETNEATMVETTIVPIDESYIANENEIDELSNYIFISSSIILMIVILGVLVFKVKKKK